MSTARVATAQRQGPGMGHLYQSGAGAGGLVRRGAYSLVTAGRPGQRPRPILKNALRMLKPGGYLQWDELEPWGAFTATASKQMKDEAVNDFQKRQELTAMSTLE